MRSSICVFYIALFWLPVAAAAQTSAPTQDPDVLYRDRANLTSAKQAAAILDARLKGDASNFEAAWKLARIMYWLGTHDAEAAQRSDLERGVDLEPRVAQLEHGILEPKRPEGYFWMAADMGALAESFGLRQGLKYRGEIKDALETVLKLDPAFQKGSADRALGRWYLNVPGLLGGSKKKSEEHLRKSLTYDPNSIASHWFLAETLFEMERDADAREELRKTIAAPLDPDWEPEEREFKKLAEERLKKK